MKLIRVLVTGGGSGVGQSIFKALRMASLPLTIISADIDPINPTFFRADEVIIIPKVEMEGALSDIITIIKEKHIDVIMVGSEFELEFFAIHKDEIQGETGCLVVVAPLKTVQLANDKWLTAEFLRMNNLPYAKSYIPHNLTNALNKANEWGYPLMLKTRTGTSTRHVHIVYRDKDILKLYESVPKPMLQWIINTPDKQLGYEYTCSIFKCSDGHILGPFTARRTLRWGTSWIIEVDGFVELYPLLSAIGEKIDFMGSFNVQLMAGKDGPVPFEFNARFSGTTAVRAHFGFNEPEMVLRNYYLKEDLSKPIIRNGLALRYLEEVFLEGATVKDIREPLPKGVVKQWF